MAASSHIENNTEDRQILEHLSKIAAENTDILLIGPSDLDKERYARHIHEHSPRRKAAIVPVDCRTVADSLESALFGNASDPFNGTQPQGGGLIVAAEGGTLFLDNIDALTLNSQVLLLRFLQEKVYRRPGETRIRRANVRIVAATSADICAAVRAGHFRKDLFDSFTCIQLKSPVGPCDQPQPGTLTNGQVPPKPCPPIPLPKRPLLWPYGVLSALFFVPTTWVVFVGLVALIRQEIYWPDPAVNHLVLWGVGIISVIPLVLVILDAVLRNKGNVNGTGGG